jgi:hypothetical protein
VKPCLPHFPPASLFTKREEREGEGGERRERGRKEENPIEPKCGRRRGGDSIIGFMDLT